MKALTDIQHELRELLLDGLDQVIPTAKLYLIEGSDSFSELLLIETRFREIQREQLDGTLSYENARIEMTRLNRAFLLFVDGLKEGNLAGNPSPAAADLRNGEVLYRIPEKMVVERETKCVVRCAFDRTVILDGWEMQAGDVLLDKKIGDLMGVQLLDAANTGAFSIRAISDEVQYLEKDIPTEWIFYVKALREGNFPLTIKIAVMEKRDGELRKRNIILDEEIQVVTSGDEPTEGIEKSSGQTFQTGQEPKTKSAKPVFPQPSPARPAAPPSSSAPAMPSPKASNSMLKRVIGSVGALALLIFSTYALTNYFRGTDDLTAQREVEKKDWHAAKTDGSTEKMADFIEKHPESVFADSAKATLEKLETTEWLAAKTSADSFQVKKFAMKFPASKHRPEAQMRLEKWAIERDSLLRVVVKKGETPPLNAGPSGQKLKATDFPKKPKTGIVVPPKTNESTTVIEPPKKEEISNEPISMKNAARLPVFPACDQADAKKEAACTDKKVSELVAKYLSFPEKAASAKVEGTVSVRFIVERDGSISNIRTDSKLGYGCEEEAMRVVRLLPRFKAGQNALGQPVRVNYVLPIRFSQN